MTHKKAILLIIAVVLLTFGNSVFNGFVGDDTVMFQENTFYRSWSNVSRIFSPDFIIDRDAVINRKGDDLSSGAVSYRPVIFLTHFVDYWIWKLNPFGYHLQNLLLHLFNSLLMFLIVSRLIKRQDVALWAALLFAVHPIQSESVCAISYRHGLLANLFILISFWFYIRWRDCSRQRYIKVLVLSSFFYLLALFSKESVIVYPALLAGYDCLALGQRPRGEWRSMISRYSGFVAASVFYLYLYTMVFPNSALSDAALLGGTWGRHLLTSVKIFSLYCVSFIFPPAVKILPPVYAPAVSFDDAAGIILSLTAIFSVVVLFRHFMRKNRMAAFFLLWFCLGLIPVSNIIPLVNPMAYRFLYFPAVGMMVVLSFLIHGASSGLLRLLKRDVFVKALKAGILVLCMMLTLSLNFSWKNDLFMALSMVDDSPEHPRGYLHLGLAYFNLGLTGEACETLEKGIAKGLEDPRAYHTMGICRLDDFEQSRPYYEMNVREFPGFARSYTGLGRIHLLQSEPQKALPYLEKSIQLAPDYWNYGYLIQSYLMLGQEEAARAVLPSALNSTNDPQHKISLGNFIKLKDQVVLPVDIGL